MEELEKLVKEIVRSGGLIKAVFSRPRDKSVIRTTSRIIELKNKRYMQFETFLCDGKALQKNVPEEDCTEEIMRLASRFRQIDLITGSGTCEALISKSGSCHIKNGIKGKPLPVPLEKNDREHRFILDPEKAAPFLHKLGVCDENGRIFDKKRSKFRQINRFVEILDDVYRYLPDSGTITVCDLCCGKSYLTFAVYYYLTAMKGRSVEMYGVDLKSDVIAFCQKTAEELHFDGMHFYCMNISDFHPQTKPSLVVSLHACDVATDVVIYNALRLDVDVALLTPCCHHEMMKQLSCAPLAFVSEHSMYRQKLCDALTDALRCKRIESYGYKVTALELIDPEETPKNILIKAIRTPMSEEKKAAALNAYKEAIGFLGVHPYLDALLSGETPQ